MANVLNENKKLEAFGGVEDDMFDVPLNDDRSYVGPDLNNGDALTSETSYAKAPSKPSRKKISRSKSARTEKVGNLTEDDEYSFDVEL